MTTTVSQAVEKRDDTPAGLITHYTDSFARVLPSHIKPDTWVRLTQGALRRGKRINAPNPKAPDHADHGKFELEVAARNNPPVFLAALLDAARLGLEPGTEMYYLTPRKIQGRLEILGIVGYQGYIDLMYRAGAVSSVVVKVVRERDEYEFMPGQLDRQSPPRWEGPQRVPWHFHRPFARESERGGLVGVYAYATMRNGAVSQVVELNRDDIELIKSANPAAKSEYSPWVRFEVSMWMKSAARQLRKWVPTSAEYRREQAAVDMAAREVAAEHEFPPAPSEDPDTLDGEVIDSIDDQGDEWPTPASIPGDHDGAV